MNEFVEVKKNHWINLRHITDILFYENEQKLVIWFAGDNNPVEINGEDALSFLKRLRPAQQEPYLDLDEVPW